MEIKDWLKENRKRQGLTLTELSLKTGINNGQLSRVETGSSSLTLFSIVRIMHVLNLSLSSLFYEGLIDEGSRGLPIYKNAKPSNLECLNFGDIDALTASGLIKSGKASEIVVALTKTFIEKFELPLSVDRLTFISKGLYSYLGNTIKTTHGLPKELAHISFSYPNEMDPKVLREIYLAGGVFIMQDLSFYIKQLRQSKKISLREQAKAIEMTHPALRALETRMNDKVKLDDIINLDKKLELDGELIVFAWRTAEFYMGISQIASKLERKVYPREIMDVQLVEKLIVLSRLFLYYFPTDFEWLKWYRKNSLSGFGKFK
jgi:transcriptional regulator with XRE-family HTH domain